MKCAALRRFAVSLTVATLMLQGATSALAHTGYFISIDGLQPDLLEKLIETGQLDAPHGLKWLSRGARVERVRPVVTSLTASSHVSTITCTPPSRHGIVSNAFMAGGVKVNGFAQAFLTEPLWRAAMRQGKKVLSLAYVGSDGTTPERSADFGLAYPNDALIAPQQIVDWDVDALTPARGWTVQAKTAKSDADPSTWKEATVELTLNPKTLEKRTLHALVIKQGTGSRSSVEKIVFDTDKDLSNGVLGTLEPQREPAAHFDVFFTETGADSTLKGVKRRAFLRPLPAAAGHVKVYVSRASYNNAYPESFRRQLDDANLVWPDYGVRYEPLPAGEYFEYQTMIDTFLTDVGERFAPLLGVDLVLFYQPIIDSLGHKWQSALPRPFDPSAQDDVTKAFVAGFQLVDRNVSRLVSASGVDSVVALMGDHGMDPSLKVVNLAPLLPSDHLGKVNVVPSGALALLYDVPGSSLAAEYGKKLAKNLRALRYQGLPTMGKAHFKDAHLAIAAGAEPIPPADWPYGEAQVAITAGAGFWWAYAPLTSEVLQAPPALGMHGYEADQPQMSTTLMFRAPHLRPRVIPTGSLIDAVPTFSKLMGIEPPADCEGKALF